ncbi:MAG: sulfatase [Verrucomicrobiota bacterium]|nr:sulfatase [Verrucomicrobiota bacterium]
MKPNLTRAEFIYSVAGAALAPAALIGSAQSATTPVTMNTKQSAKAMLPSGRQPNIVYVVVHDLGRHLGCYGTKVRSPNLDRIATEGARLDNFFCASAVCSPSRGCAMTGLHAHTNGMVGLAHFGWRFNPGVRTVPEYLRDLGYETTRIGYSHEGDEGNPLRRYDTDMAVSWRTLRVENAVDSAVAFLKNRSESADKTPFYLNIGMIETHPSAYLEEVDKYNYNRPGRLHYTYGGPIPEDEVTIPQDMPDNPAVRSYMAKFEASIRFMDGEVGRLYDQLIKLGYGKDTVFILTTDHGMNGPRGKGTLFDHGLSITGLVRLPDSLRKPGAVHTQLLQNIDILPTLIEVAGGTPPPHLHGRSFWPLLIGKDYHAHEALFAEWNCGGPAKEYRPVRTVRTAQYRYIRHLTDTIPHYLLPDEWRSFTPVYPADTKFPNPWPESRLRPPGSLREELYDISTDPHLQQNVAAEQSYANIKTSLATRLDDWMHTVGDFALDPNYWPVAPTKPGFEYIPDGSGR